MADSLVLIGTSDIRHHTGTELALVMPTGKGGAGDQHVVKRWWKGTTGKMYCKATVLQIQGGGRLAVVAPHSSRVRIDIDGAELTFSGVHRVDHIALFTDEMELVEYYVMPKIAGGRVMKVIPADGADNPLVPAPVPPVDLCEGVTCSDGETCVDGACVPDGGGFAIDSTDVDQGKDCPKPRKKTKIRIEPTEA